MVLQSFVEGNDIKFIKDLVSTLNLPISETIFNDTKGWTNLRHVKGKFEEGTFKNSKNIVIFDADGNPAQRRQEIINERNKLGVEFNLFLFPDNQNPGIVEDLLLQLIPADKLDIVGCFDAYSNCVQAINPTIFIPSKSKLYAYTEATGQCARLNEIDFLDNNFWNLDHPSLNPLKSFILEAVNN